MKNKILLISLIFWSALSLSAQDFTQNIRGQVLDAQTQSPLPGANVVILGTNPPRGTITDEEGYFLLEDVKTGRVSLQVSFIGYLPRTLSNLNLTTGKELVLKIPLEERVIQTEEVVIKAGKDKTKANDESAVVSARQFTIEETQRYAGARNDVSRMATNYAGVSTANDAVNDIVIRGNSPNGLLWRLEGVPIPNPNHYGGMGATGGPVSMLNTNVLSNSDFMTSAFPAEYGNALSGVFDLEMRNGNYEKYEFLGQLGFNGFEIGVEGPISRKRRSSFLINYRYSMLGIASAIGVDVGTGTAVPYYQDLSFKVHLPTKNMGTFNLFGLGGLNHIEFKNSEADEEDPDNLYDEDFLDVYSENDLGVVGISHTYLFSKNAYSKLVLSASRIGNHNIVDSISQTDNSLVDFVRQHYKKYDLTGHLYFNKKFSAKHNLRVGVQVTHKIFDLMDSLWIEHEGKFTTQLEDKDNTQLFEAYAQWLFRLNDQFALTTGVHYLQLALNNNFSVEPRAGLKWQLAKNQSINLGYGLHSQALPVYSYFYRTELDNGDYVRPNMNLDFIESHHFVLGYDWNITPTLRIKAETYYQSIPQAVVEPTSSTFSLLNSNSFVWQYPDTMVNGGSGRNYGVELTLEKFLENGLYYLVTASLFDSKYKGSDGVLRSTIFDSQYVLNFLGGKEFELFANKPDAKYRKWLTLDARITAAGGQRYMPVDVEASLANGATEYMQEQGYSEQFSDYFRADVRLALRLDGKKVSQEWAFDMQNITNHKNPLRRVFDRHSGEVKTVYQLGLFPMVQYRLVF